MVNDEVFDQSHAVDTALLPHKVNTRSGSGHV